jgi:DNA repair protein RecN (Recombination protein N)
MLRELHISNLAVIADARVELHGGLNCFTGATGAGKSLVIGAVEVLLGLRSSGELLRRGADEGRVSGVFEVNDAAALAEIERLTDVPVTKDGGELLLTRKLYASGRSSVSLNGNPITLSMLKGVGEALVDVHGQHDHQYLLKPSNQLVVLDQYAETVALRNQYHAAYAELQQTRACLHELATGRDLRAQQLDLYKFQADEIDNAQLNADEYKELEARASVLQHLEKIKKDTSATYAALYEADGAVLERLKTMAAIVTELAMLDPALEKIGQPLKDATLQLEDAAFELGRYIDRLDLDPGELAEVNDRLNTIHRVLNKYAGDVEGTLALRAEIGAKLAELERAGDDSSALAARVAPLERQVKELGGKLSAQRKKAAAELGKLIEKELADLGMDKAKFTIDLQPSPEPIPSGLDLVEFIAQTNPGLTPQPLRKIASGGEMSRIMLGLKSVLAAGDRVSVLVFDEIDSNVGGRLGAIIGGKLRKLATHHQVLCITHLPQIAAYADRHITVRKEQTKDVTSTTVKLMAGDERIEELAEMIGGHRITETTRAQARELLDTAADKAGKKDANGTAKRNGAASSVKEPAARRKSPTR